MGGKEASRGFQYQTIISVFAAFEDNEWDQISVEFKTDDDKVDIALLKVNHIQKSIQVKSSINPFKPGDLMNWLYKMESDLNKKGMPVEEYVVHLVGAYTSNVSELIKAFKKYNEQQDLYLREGGPLEDFQIERFRNSKINIFQSPFEIVTLMSIVHSKIHKYSELRGLKLSYSQIDLISHAIINVMSQFSTEGKMVSREEYEKTIDDWLLEIKNEIIKKTKKISIRSFERATEIHDEADFPICLLDMFKGRMLDEAFSWDDDVCIKLADKLIQIKNLDFIYQLHLNSHASIAFATGRFFDSKRGIEIYPIQRTANQGEQVWSIDEIKTNYPSLIIESVIIENVDPQIMDVVLIINISHKITGQVEKYLEKNRIKTKTKIICKLDNCSNTAVLNGNHANQLAKDILNVLNQNDIFNESAVLHLFISAPNSFSFYLGRLSRSFGKFILYEYDFEKLGSKTYSPSLTFPNPKFDTK